MSELGLTTPRLRRTPPTEGNLPQLRFPEFKDAGVWEEKSLGDICDYWNGGSHEGNITEYGEYYLISLNSIDIEGNLKVDMKRLSISDNSLKANDLVMVLSDVAHGDFLGLTDIIPNEKYVLNQRMAGLRLKNESLGDVFFLKTFINLSQGYFKQKGQGSSQQNLAKSAVIEFPVLFPKKQEQQKIAACLSSLDDLISAQSQKIEALKQHKKGLMQQLFPHSPPLEGWQAQPDGVVSSVSQQPDGVGSDDQTTPRLRRTPPTEGNLPQLRFPEFKDTGAWEEKTFGTIATFINGRAYKQEELLDKGKYRVLRVGNFFTNKEWYFSDLELEKDKYCDKGDLLYSWSASFGPRIWTEEKVVYHYHIWKVLEGENIDKQFLFVLLDYETERMKASSANGLGLLHITKGAIEGWKCYIPPFPEQQKIAACLSSLDDLISAQSQKIEALKQHKKGLMQQLFPHSPPLEGWQAQPDGVVSSVVQRSNGVVSSPAPTFKKVMIE